MSTVTELTVDEGRVLRVIGPARIEVVAGVVLAVGSRFKEGSSLIVHRLRSYGIKALTNAKLRIFLGEDSKVEEVGEGEEVVDEWLKVSEKALSKCVNDMCRIVVVGPPESGKSTLTAFIANYLRESGLRVGVIEGDVGQEDILVPATIALAEVSKPVLWLRELGPMSFRFVGCTSPQYCYTESILAIRELVDDAVRLGIRSLVINTDGWVRSPQALQHKLTIIRFLRPSMVVALSEEVFDFISRCVDKLTEVIYAPRPRIVRERSRDERRELRIQAYRRYLGRGRVRRVRLGEVGLFHSHILGGHPLNKDEIREIVKIAGDILEKVVYSSKVGDTIFLVTREPENMALNAEGSVRVVVTSLKEMKGVLVGIFNEEMREVGIGVVMDVDMNKQEVDILTPWEGAIRGLIVGRVRLGENLEEIGRVTGCTL